MTEKCECSSVAECLHRIGGEQGQTAEEWELDRERNKVRELEARIAGLDQQVGALTRERDHFIAERRALSFHAYGVGAALVQPDGTVTLAGPASLETRGLIPELRAEVERLADSRRKLLDEVEHHRAEVERWKTLVEAVRKEGVRIQANDDARGWAFTVNDRAVKAEAEVERLTFERDDKAAQMRVVLENRAALVAEAVARQREACEAELGKVWGMGRAREMVRATPLVTDAPGTIAEAVARHPDIVAAEPVLGVMAVPGPKAVQVEQPAPTLGPDSVPVWPEVLRRAPKWLHPHLEARRALGLKLYGVELHTHNGRSMCRDMNEELLDALVYGVAESMEDGTGWQTSEARAMDHLVETLRLRLGVAKEAL